MYQPLPNIERERAVSYDLHFCVQLDTSVPEGQMLADLPCGKERRVTASQVYDLPAGAIIRVSKATYDRLAADPTSVPIQ